MRFLLTGDIHTCDPGLSRASKQRIPLVKQLFEDLATLVQREKIDGGLIINGDLFDKKKNPGMQSLCCVYNCLLQFTQTINHVSVHLLGGNHEYDYYFLLQLFSEISRVHAYTKENRCLHVRPPNGSCGNEAVLYFLPWAPPDIYQENLTNLLKTAEQPTTAKQYLITHLPTPEGRPNLESPHIGHAISAKTLRPDLFSLTFLSDYHNHQFLSDDSWSNDVFYMGAPFALSFGEENCPGVWALDTTLDAAYSIALPSRYPQFKSSTILADAPVPVANYDPFDYYRIHCKAKFLPEYMAMYPEAEVVPLPEESLPQIVIPQALSREGQLQKYIDWKNPELPAADLLQMGMQILND